MFKLTWFLYLTLKEQYMCLQWIHSRGNSKLVSWSFQYEGILIPSWATDNSSRYFNKLSSSITDHRDELQTWLINWIINRNIPCPASFQKEKSHIFKNKWRHKQCRPLKPQTIKTCSHFQWCGHFGKRWKESNKAW